MPAAGRPALDGSAAMQPLHAQPLWPGGPLPPPQLPAHNPAATRSPSFPPAAHLPPAAPPTLPEEVGRAPHRRFRCDICDIYTTSAELLESHLGGRKHLRRLVSLAEQRGETLAPSVLQAARWYSHSCLPLLPLPPLHPCYPVPGHCWSLAGWWQMNGNSSAWFKSHAVQCGWGSETPPLLAAPFGT